MSADATITRTMTIHIVNSVELIAGWKVMRSLAAGTDPGARSMTVAGAGNSSVLWMKQTGRSQAWPGWPPFGKGGVTTKAAMSSRTTAAISSSHRPRELLRRLGASAGASVESGSLDTHPPVPRGRAAALIDCLEEPGDQSVDQHGPAPGSDEEADDHEDRHGAKLRVDPVAGAHAHEGRDQQGKADLGEEGRVGKP